MLARMADVLEVPAARRRWIAPHPQGRRQAAAGRAARARGRALTATNARSDLA